MIDVVLCELQWLSSMAHPQYLMVSGVGWGAWANVNLHSMLTIAVSGLLNYSCIISRAHDLSGSLEVEPQNGCICFWFIADAIGSPLGFFSKTVRLVRL